MEPLHVNLYVTCSSSRNNASVILVEETADLPPRPIVLGLKGAPSKHREQSDFKLVSCKMFW